MNSPSASCTACAAFASACSLSRISASSGSRSLHRVQVEDQPVPVGRDRRQREQLRRDRLLQVEHQAHHARLVLADAHAGDERVVGLHLADQLAQLRAELEAVDVDHQPRRVLGEEVLRRRAPRPTRSSRGCSRPPARRARRRSLAPKASSRAPSSRARRAHGAQGLAARGRGRHAQQLHAAGVSASIRSSRGRRSARSAAMVRRRSQRRQQRRGLLRPFDELEAGLGEDVAKAGVLPFLGSSKR